MLTKRIAVTGYKGRLGSELVKRGCLPLDCDVTSRLSIKQALRDVDPEIVVHCAAITDVDYCQEFKEEALEVNGRGTENLKVLFEGRIVYLSTDYVFNGKGKGMYTEDDKPSDPKTLCWYGFTKLVGEEFLGLRDTIIRTTMLYGSPKKDDFVDHILQNLGLNTPFKVTRALYGTPTYIPHLADAIINMVNLHASFPHIINIAGGDLLSRYEFALLIASYFGKSDKKYLIEPTMKIGKVKRPRRAGLNVRKAMNLGLPIYSVNDGLSSCYVEKTANTFRQLELPI